MSNWISVKDDLPETGFQPTNSSLPVLVYTTEMDEDCFPCIAYLSCKGKWYSQDFIDGEVVTHWMPLPDPPKENENE